MYRIVKTIRGIQYAMEIDSVEDDFENIDLLVGEGDVVLICDNLESLEEYDFDVKDIEVLT